MLRLAILPCSVALATALFAQPSYANGQFPAANQIVVSPGDETMVVLRSTFGVLLSRDRGDTWDWICEQAIGYPNGEEAFLGVTADSTILGGTAGGLVRSSDGGCSWTGGRDSTDGRPITDLTVRPDAPEVAFALSSEFTDVGDLGLRYDTYLFASTDNGQRWTLAGPALPASAKALTVEVAKSDPSRVYVSAVRAKAEGTGWVGLIYSSNDTGATWTESTIPLTDEESAPYVAGVDPMDPNRVYVRTFGITSRLLVSTDGAESFSSVFSGAQLLGFALSPGGATVYVGGPSDGLLVGTVPELSFSRVSPIAVRCLTVHGSTLFVCSNDASAFTVGTSEDGGETLTARLRLDGIRGPLACPAETSAAICPSLWENQQTILGLAGEPSGAGGAAPMVSRAGAASDSEDTSPEALNDPALEPSCEIRAHRRGGSVPSPAWMVLATITLVGARIRRASSG